MCQPVARNDGWTSALTGVGTVGSDKRLSYSWDVSAVSTLDATMLRAGNDLAARVIEDKPDECWREGYDVSVDDDQQLGDDIVAEWESLGLERAFVDAMCFKRQFGGGAVLLGIIGGTAEQDQPVSSVANIAYTIGLEANEIQPVEWYDDPAHPKYGQPAIYMLNVAHRGAGYSAARNQLADLGIRMSGHRVHESRVIPFCGPVVSRTNPEIGVTVSGWGVSALTRVQSVLRGFDLTWDAAEMLVLDFAQSIWKVKSLAELIAADGEAFKARVKAFNMGRSIANISIIDAEEEFKREQTPINGLPDLMKMFQSRFAAAAGMPVTKLFGQAPAGLNATGEYDMKSYHESIKIQQSKEVAPAIARVVDLQLRARGREGVSYAVIPRPLEQQNEKEIADARKVQADTDAAYIDRGVLGPDEVRSSRFGGDEYSYETTIDVTDLDERETDEPIDPRGVVEPTVPETTEPAKTAMNGAQVTSLVAVAQAVGNSELSRRSGAGILKVAFQLSQAEADEILPAENEIEDKPEPPSMPPGLGVPPAPPPDDPDREEKPDNPDNDPGRDKPDDLEGA